MITNEERQYQEIIRKLQNIDLRCLRRPSQISQIEALVPKPHNPLPPNPLPKWEEVPLYQKFPIVPSAHGQFPISRHAIGDSLFRSYECNNPCRHFDTTDPYLRHTPTEYEALHDPNLRQYFQTHPRAVKQLLQQRLINQSGNVLCTVKAYNKYREYLSRVHSYCVNVERDRRERVHEAGFQQLKDIQRYLRNEANTRKAAALKEKMDNMRAARKRRDFLAQLREIAYPSTKHQENLAFQRALSSRKREALRLQRLAKVNQQREMEPQRNRTQVLEWYCKDLYAERVRQAWVQHKKDLSNAEREDFVSSKREFQEKKHRYEKAILLRAQLEKECAVVKRGKRYTRLELIRKHSLQKKAILAKKKEARALYLLRKYGRRWLAIVESKRKAVSTYHDSLWAIRGQLRSLVAILRAESGTQSFTSFIKDLIKLKPGHQVIEMTEDTRGAVDYILSLLIERTFQEHIRKMTSCLLDFWSDEARFKMAKLRCPKESMIQLEDFIPPDIRRRFKPQIEFHKPLWPCSGPCASLNVKETQGDWTERCRQMANCLTQAHTQISNYLVGKRCRDLERELLAPSPRLPYCKKAKRKRSKASNFSDFVGKLVREAIAQSIANMRKACGEKSKDPECTKAKGKDVGVGSKMLPKFLTEDEVQEIVQRKKKKGPKDTGSPSASSSVSDLAERVVTESISKSVKNFKQTDSDIAIANLLAPKVKEVMPPKAKGGVPPKSAQPSRGASKPTQSAKGIVSEQGQQEDQSGPLSSTEEMGAAEESFQPDDSSAAEESFQSHDSSAAEQLFDEQGQPLDEEQSMRRQTTEKMGDGTQSTQPLQSKVSQLTQSVKGVAQQRQDQPMPQGVKESETGDKPLAQYLQPDDSNAPQLFDEVMNEEGQTPELNSMPPATSQKMGEAGEPLQPNLTNATEPTGIIVDQQGRKVEKPKSPPSTPPSSGATSQPSVKSLRPDSSKTFNASQPVEGDMDELAYAQPSERVSSGILLSSSSSDYSFVDEIIRKKLEALQKEQDALCKEYRESLAPGSSQLPSTSSDSSPTSSEPSSQSVKPDASNAAQPIGGQSPKGMQAMSPPSTQSMGTTAAQARPDLSKPTLPPQGIVDKQGPKGEQPVPPAERKSSGILLKTTSSDYSFVDEIIRERTDRLQKERDLLHSGDMANVALTDENLARIASAIVNDSLCKGLQEIHEFCKETMGTSDLPAQSRPTSQTSSSGRSYQSDFSNASQLVEGIVDGQRQKMQQSVPQPHPSSQSLPSQPTTPSSTQSYQSDFSSATQLVQGIVEEQRKKVEFSAQGTPARSSIESIQSDFSNTTQFVKRIVEQQRHGLEQPMAQARRPSLLDPYEPGISNVRSEVRQQLNALRGELDTLMQELESQRSLAGSSREPQLVIPSATPSSSRTQSSYRRRPQSDTIELLPSHEVSDSGMTFPVPRQEFVKRHTTLIESDTSTTAGFVHPERAESHIRMLEDQKKKVTLELIAPRGDLDSVMQFPVAKDEFVRRHTIPIESDMSTTAGFGVHAERAESHIRTLDGTFGEQAKKRSSPGLLPLAAPRRTTSEYLLKPAQSQGPSRTSETIELLPPRDVAESVMNFPVSKDEFVHKHTISVESDMSTVAGFGVHHENAESHIRTLDADKKK